MDDPRHISEFSNYMRVAKIVMKLDHLRSYVPKKQEKTFMPTTTRITSAATNTAKDTSSTASNSQPKGKVKSNESSDQ